jgi:hypothetical protein
MDTEKFRKQIRGRISAFASKDERTFPDILIHVMSNKRPSGEVYLYRKGKRSNRIDVFNTSGQLGMIIETILREWRKTSSP